MNLTDLIRNVMHAKHWRVKAYVRVRAKWRRDAKGRFSGLECKGYVRRQFDRKAPKVSNMEILAENVTSNNYLLKTLSQRGAIHVG